MFFRKILNILTLAGLLIVSFSPVWAAEVEQFDFNQATQKLQISGSCRTGPVMTQIFPLAITEPFYTSTVVCLENRFQLSDDLSYWQIATGTYNLKLFEEGDHTFQMELLINEPTAEMVEQVSSSTEDYLPDDSQDSKPPQDDNAWDRDTNVPPGLVSLIVHWLKDAIIRIKKIIADELITSKMCLGETCLFENQLKELLEKNSIPVNVGNEIITTSTIN